jgi:UDP-3-O-acyl-N-acetylglucosamine deacetylase
MQADHRPETSLTPSVSLAGLGVHTGSPSLLRISRSDRPAAAGPSFRLPGRSRPLSPEELGDLPRTALRSTVLGRLPAEGESPGAEAPLLRTPEHLLAALLFFSDLPLDIACDGPEPPGLDGSALPYRDALASLAPDRESAPAWREYECDLAWEYHWSYGSMRVRPSERFRVRFELDRGPLRQTVILADAREAWDGILPARTFAFHREWKEASAAGMMAGADAGSGLLLAESEAEHAALLREHPRWRGGPFPLLNQPGWRMDQEAARHKILDLLGDLALLGLALPKLDIEVRNGGHGVNHMLLDRLAPRR